MHEFVASCQKLKEQYGISALDISKALIERGYHPPTMYFPSLVHEALMFEPTESESMETLDKLAETIGDIVKKESRILCGFMDVRTIWSSVVWTK